MKENIMVRIFRRIGRAFRTTGSFIINNSGKIFLLIIAVSLLTYVGYQVRRSPKSDTIAVKETTQIPSLGNDYLDNARQANLEKDYQTAYDQANLYLKSENTTQLGEVEAYLSRGEAQIYLLNCKDAMSDLYTAADIAPNDTKLQARIADKLNIIFYGKECDGKY